MAKKVYFFDIFIFFGFGSWWIIEKGVDGWPKVHNPMCTFKSYELSYELFFDIKSEKKRI